MIAEKKRGFAGMTPERRREIAAMGGRAAQAKNPRHWTKEECSAQGRKGGAAVSKNVAHMATIGRKGGLAASADVAHMSEIGRMGGLKISADAERMRALGAKGGRRKARNAALKPGAVYALTGGSGTHVGVIVAIGAPKTEAS